MITTLLTDPKMAWQGNPVWDPYSWCWATAGVTTVNEGCEKDLRLLSVHDFPEKDGGAALQVLIGLEKMSFSTVLRLDDVASIPKLFKKLQALRGYSLEQIGEVEF